jgi:sialidase-1
VADSVSGSWRRLATIASPHPESLSLGEPHMLQLKTGRVIMMIRATAHPYNDLDPRCVLWESYSDDNGKTWVAPFATSLWGSPPHLVLLADGRVLCTYGYRRPPYGQRACLSDDGLNWSLREEVVLRDDAPNGDLGYPASVELERGVILTVYYQPDVPPGTFQRMNPPDPHRTKPGILGTIWKVPPAR